MKGVVGLEKGATFCIRQRKVKTRTFKRWPWEIIVKYFMKEEISLVCISWKENDIHIIVSLFIF
jgi:hypothetical protein